MDGAGQNWGLATFAFVPNCVFGNLPVNFASLSNMVVRAPDKMRICVFHSNLNVKNSIIFGNVRIMYAKHFPDTQLCPVSKRICFVYILMECGLLPIFP